MSRRLIISLLIILILGIVGGTVVLVIQRLLPAGSNVASNGENTGTLPNAEGTTRPVLDPLADEDGDGLSNGDEDTWGANPYVRDTDSDGFQDGEEVRAGHNPTIAGPNDILPPGFQPGQNLEPSAVPVTSPELTHFITLERPNDSSTLSLATIDSLFVEGLDLSGGSSNFTQEYERLYAPAQRTAETLRKFTESKPLVTKLPSVANKPVIFTNQSSTSALRTYLSVAREIRSVLDRELLIVALDQLFLDDNTSDINDLRRSIVLYQETLLATRVPPAAVALNKLLLGYTDVLAATLRQIGLWEQDQVKALVGIRQLDAIDRLYYPLILQELRRLENL
jgi:hypothetical protein